MGRLIVCQAMPTCTSPKDGLKIAMDLSEHPAFIFALIGLLGISAQWLAWWLKLPAIVFLLLMGMIAGPMTGLVKPDALLGDLLFPVVSLGVAVILFEGSLTLRFRQIKGLGDAVRNLVTVGALFNWLAIGTATHYLLTMSWDMALLFGALVTVTGPTVIVPMLRTVRPTAKIAQVLRWESIIIDPLGALLAVLAFEFVAYEQEEQMALLLGETIVLGVLAGVIGAYVLATILRRHLMPDYLHNVTALVLVLTVFSISNALLDESGLLAVTVMGIMLANMKGVHVDEILDFKENLSLLFISGLFIVLAARIDLNEFKVLDRNALLLLGVIMFLVRPAAVFISTVFANLNWREKTMIAWIGPRGIVAAAIAPLFVLKLEAFNYDQSQLLVPLTFAVILGTVVLQGFTARFLANWLKVSEPIPHGVLIVSAGKVARAIARMLKQQGYRIVLADTNWDHISAARMEGLETFFGNVVSEHADRHLDLVGIGRLFAMSRHPALNALACLRYQAEFGSNAVYSLKTSQEKNNAKKQTPTAQHRYPRLFSEDVTYARLAELFEQGAQIRATSLTENFDFAVYRSRYGEGALPLFALDEKQNLHVFTADGRVRPMAGWTVISLLSGEITDRKGDRRSVRRRINRNARQINSAS